MCYFIFVYFLTLVDEMREKYGNGESYIRKCETCDFEMEMRSSGVNVSEGGSVSVYADEDEFCCPNCPEKSDEVIQVANEVTGRLCVCVSVCCVCICVVCVSVCVCLSVCLPFLARTQRCLTL